MFLFEDCVLEPFKIIRSDNAINNILYTDEIMLKSPSNFEIVLESVSFHQEDKLSLLTEISINVILTLILSTHIYVGCIISIFLYAFTRVEIKTNIRIL